MEPTIGKALRDARLKKGLTLEEVSKTTRIRQDWLGDLEEENYLRFPSLAYARNFQILYAKHLGLDLNGIQVVEAGKPTLTTSFDHIYDGVTPVGYRGTRKRRPIRRSRWILAFIIFSAASAVGAITALFILDVLRLPTWEEMTGESKPAQVEPALRDPILPSPTPTVPPPAGEPTPEPEPQETLPAESGDAADAAPDPALEPVFPLGDSMLFRLSRGFSTEVAPSLEGKATLQNPAPGGPSVSSTLADPTSQIPAFPYADDIAALATPFPPSDPLVETAEATPTPEALPTPARELEINATKRTRIKVYIDDATSTPAYDLWLSPGRPLKISGTRIWIESQNLRAFTLTSQGAPLELPPDRSRGKIEIQ